MRATIASFLLLTTAVATSACGPPKSSEATDSKAAHRAGTPRPARTPLAPAPGLVALRGGTVMTGVGTRFENGVVVIENGKILSVGGAETPIPPDATVIDTTGRFVTPGLLDAHSHMGVYAAPSVLAHSDGNEASDPNTAEVNAFHSFWPRDPALARAVEGGVTTALILPGSANLFGGRGSVFKLKPGRSAFEMKFPGAPDSLKMACGENPKRVYGEGKGAPQTRMGNVAGYREAWIEAQQYREKLKEWKRTGDDDKKPERDLKLETLAGALDGKILVQNHCYRADEMEVMMTVAHEFGYAIRAFHHSIEAYKVRDLLAQEDVAIATWADWWGFKMESFDGIPENAALNHEAGVRVVIHSDSDLDGQRLNQEAAKAMWAGRHAGINITEDDALRWVTSNAAWIIGVDEWTGSLEKGKMADIVVWTENPLSFQARAGKVYSDGQLIYDRDDPSTHFVSDFELGLVPQPGKVR